MGTKYRNRSLTANITVKKKDRIKELRQNQKILFVGFVFITLILQCFFSTMSKFSFCALETKILVQIVSVCVCANGTCANIQAQHTHHLSSHSAKSRFLPCFFASFKLSPYAHCVRNNNNNN